MKILLAALFSVLLSGAALAQNMPPPFPLSTMNRVSSTIAVGGTSQQAISANPGVKAWCVENPAAATEDLFLDFGRAASTTSGVSIDIQPGAMFCAGGAAIWTGQVTVNATTGGHAYVAYWGQ